MSSTATSQSFSYSVFSFVTDEIRGSLIPVGIALWSPNPKQVRIRFASDKEKVKGLKGNSYTYLRIAQQQIKQWVNNEKLPYSEAGLSPQSDVWWKHVSQLMVHSIRLSEPRPIDCRNVDDETELLFEAVVGPERNQHERTERVDSVLSAALGRSLVRKLERGTVAGFQGRPVPVKHFKSVGETLLIVEAVNLAAAAAEIDTDALVSRLQRIKAANGSTANRSIQAFVGYLASPHGLNGEAALVEWIKEMAGAKTFDLLREGDKLQENVELSVEALQSSKPPMFH